MPESRLLVDTRWDRMGGIGRFSREVRKRLYLPWTPLGGQGSPASPLEIFNPHRLFASRTDIIFSPGYSAGPTHAKQLLTLHDLMHIGIEGSRAKREYYEHIVRPVIEKAGVVLTVSETMRYQLIDWVANDKVRVVNVGNGIDFPKQPRDERIPYPSYLLYVGNMKAHKNFSLVLQIAERMSEYDLVVVTSDGDKANRMIADSKLMRVHRLSGVSDAELGCLYRGASALLMPSLSEGFGLPAAEALHFGTTPVVWSGCDALVEVTAGMSVQVSDIGDLGEWVRAVEAAVATVPSEAALAAWRARYDWSLVAARVAEEIKRLDNHEPINPNIRKVSAL